MTLGEMKQKVYALIEEYSEDNDDLTEDEDLAGKFNFVANQIQNELCRFKKIPEFTELNVTEGQTMNFNEIDKDLYQLDLIRGVEYDIKNNRIKFDEDGTAEIHYFKYPKNIEAETEDEYKFELTNDLLEIMPYGIAADLLKSDVSSQYGSVYAARYREMLQNLDPRYGTGTIEFTGGMEL
jgi:hypothetical protein